MKRLYRRVLGAITIWGRHTPANTTHETCGRWWRTPEEGMHLCLCAKVAFHNNDCRCACGIVDRSGRSSFDFFMENRARARLERREVTATGELFLSMIRDAKIAAADRAETKS